MKNNQLLTVYRVDDTTLAAAEARVIALRDVIKAEQELSTIEIDTIVSAGTTATVTTVQDHGFVTGNVVTIRNASGHANHNKEEVSITKTGAKTFTYTITSATATSTGEDGTQLFENVVRIELPGNPVSTSSKLVVGVTLATVLAYFQVGDALALKPTNTHYTIVLPTARINKIVEKTRALGVTVSSVVEAAGTATVTTATAHGLVAGDWVTLAGATTSDFNSTFQVAAAATTTTFTFLISGSPGTDATPETVTLTEAYSQVSAWREGSNLKVYNFNTYFTHLKKLTGTNGDTVTLVSNAGECNSRLFVVTTETLTTAADAVVDFVITNYLVGTSSRARAFLMDYSGTLDAADLPQIGEAVCTANTITVKMINKGSSAINGTLKILVEVL